MQANAYRNTTPGQTIPEVSLKQYKDLKKLIELRCLHAKSLQGSTTSPNAEIDKLTADWSGSERERFRYWFRNTTNVGGLVKAENQMTIKQAQLYLPHNVQEQIDVFKDKRRSMVRRLRKLQNELSDLFESSRKAVEWSDDRYSSAEKKLEAIQTAINQICVLLGTLRTREVAAAAITRTTNFLKKVDASVAEKFVAAIEEHGGMVKVAASASVYQVAKLLKQELDSLHYGTHLRRLFHVYEALERLGYSGISKDIEKVIQKDLSDLSGLYDTLSDVYTELLRVPSGETQESNQEKKVENISEEPVKPPMADEFKLPKTSQPTLEAPAKAPLAPAVAPTPQ
jgi:uncharacterized protein YukE